MCSTHASDEASQDLGVEDVGEVGLLTLWLRDQNVQQSVLITGKSSSYSLLGFLSVAVFSVV